MSAHRQKLIKSVECPSYMTCTKCKTDAIDGIRETLCEQCFSRWAERRVGKELREHKLITKGGTYVVENDLCASVLKAIIKGMPVTILKEEDSSRREEYALPAHAVRVRCWTLDDEIASLLSDVLDGREARHLGHAKGEIKLFLPLTDKELSTYASAKGFDFTPKPKGQIKTMLDSLEEKHPETRFSVASSAKELARIMDTK